MRFVMLVVWDCRSALVASIIALSLVIGVVLISFSEDDIAPILKEGE